ncbi:xanthine dehydrogenase small subunit [Agarilytica rhodophyticola]|uniref:xanthine dehydrogenase small subunit n=1 Tax=Agarilytica rhodophyticola TaxID=1737490 RepID=UPI000B34185F|nr:xanthine dehydrogenase small subunit [Agarilytica rhodophyticola]
MQFVINNTLITEDNLPADLTLLRYLRENQHLCGTKEGCASGDCGACTILVGSLNTSANKETVEYISVNACIAPVAIAQGKHVVTVEHLAGTPQESTQSQSEPQIMHPSQAAMVESHGSQCGFCTPGFVMSLAGLYENKTNAQLTDASCAKVSRAEVYDAISGNLCRCTGYRPIVDAGFHMFEREDNDNSGKHHHLFNDKILQQLRSITAPEENIKHKEAAFIQATSIEMLNQTLNRLSNAKVIAGGTDLMLEVTQQFKALPELIDVSNIPEMQSCDFVTDEDDVDSETTLAEEKLVIGAAVTYSQIEKQLAQRFPELCKLLTRLGSRQIRNRGTIGGNIGNASPIADTPPILLCMDAVVEIGATDGSRRKVRLDEFYLDYKKTVLKDREYIISIQLPSKNLEQFHRFYKVSKRMEDDISSVMAAIRFDIQDNKIVRTRIAFGGMAATPIRAKDAEDCFKDADVDSEIAINDAIASLKQHLNPLTDVRASAQYRLNIAVNLLYKAWLEANGEVIPDLGHHHLASDSQGGISHA